MFSRLWILYGFCTWYAYELCIWSSQTFWWYWCFPFGSSVQISACMQKCVCVILLISVVYICPHTKLLRGEFVELKIIKHLNYPDWECSCEPYRVLNRSHSLVTEAWNAAHILSAIQKHVGLVCAHWLLIPWLWKQPSQPELSTWD